MNLKLKKMKNSRITISGNYGNDEKIYVTISETTFTGEGTLDYIDDTIFKGIEVVSEQPLNTDSMSDDEFETFINQTQKYFKQKYCTKGQDFYYQID